MSRTLRIAPLLLLLPAACMMLEHAMTPKIPISPNLVLNDGTTWASAVPFNISGEWFDGNGGRVQIAEEQGFGSVTVLSEETKFLWTEGTISQINSGVTIERTLGGQTVDRIHGRLGCTAAGDTMSLTIDFGENGVWLRPVPWKLEGQWHREGVSIVLKSKGGGRFDVSADPQLGWKGGRVAVDGDKATIELDLASGGTQRFQADMAVGPAFTMKMIEDAQRELARQQEEERRRQMKGR